MTEEFNPKLQKLKQMQSLPLEQKIIVSKQRIKQWLEAWEDQCVVSFSGGVDSTVLLDLVRSVNPLEVLIQILKLYLSIRDWNTLRL